MAEFNLWLAYRDKHGSLHLGRRIDESAALVAYTVACAAPRAKGTPPPRFEDFLPQRGAVQEHGDDELLAQAMRAW